ncbi:TPA: hypothetical protein RY491_002274 [Escherichia albertii]|uniref:hypothetical protein n=1 Tax=Escherichia albertii TaxID=208962 RepID=UPI0006A0E0CD|nr:hypothetical protein [Escherichia albertii]CTV74924.1 Uncharacterised protein [Escherichia coli]EFF0797099.1 hypothetical protein [Escherichia albertii]EHG7530019.1 hypothetical protein [Escherichia albertii]MCV3256471.1 hypothetical protein [Escherichia albertii]MCV3265450.1 hypothetical protein [Escherichia albertii]
MPKTTCPICLIHSITLPHGVCQVCFNRLKAWHFHTSDFWKESWEILSSPCLSAIDVAVIIVDAAGESLLEPQREKEWHLRRLLFIGDCIDHLDDAVFFPVPRSEINACKKMAIDYWHHQSSLSITLDDISGHICSSLNIRSFSKWDATMLIGLLASGEDNLDFMWWQFIESAVCCIRNKFSEEEWLNLFHKHFHIELQRWAQQPVEQYELYFHEITEDVAFNHNKKL